jgi:hypothetical protein
MRAGQELSTSSARKVCPAAQRRRRGRCMEFDQLVDLADRTVLEEVPDVYGECRDDGFIIVLEIE